MFCGSSVYLFCLGFAPISLLFYLTPFDNKLFGSLVFVQTFSAVDLVFQVCCSLFGTFWHFFNTWCSMSFVSFFVFFG